VPVVAAVPPARPRRGWLPFVGVGLAGVLIGILLTCAAGLVFRIGFGHHGFDGGPGRHAPFEDRRPHLPDGGPFRR
jgi:hypothetical protein